MMYEAEPWICHTVLHAGGVRMVLSKRKAGPGGSERSEEHRHVLTQEGPKVVTCVQGQVGNQDRGHPHVRGALTQSPNFDPEQPEQGPCSQAAELICGADI